MTLLDARENDTWGRLELDVDDFGAFEIVIPSPPRTLHQHLRLVEAAGQEWREIPLQNGWSGCAARRHVCLFHYGNVTVDAGRCQRQRRLAGVLYACGQRIPLFYCFHAVRLHWYSSGVSSDPAQTHIQ
jgi:hypothetical protein